MDIVTHIRIELSASDGKPLLSEKHNVVHGLVGLLRVPGRLRIVGEDMLCFPSKDEAADISNKITPVDVLCASFQARCGPVMATHMKAAGFSVSEDSVATIWVRAEATNETSNTNADPANNLSLTSISRYKETSYAESQLFSTYHVHSHTTDRPRCPRMPSADHIDL